MLVLVVGLTQYRTLLSVIVITWAARMMNGMTAWTISSHMLELELMGWSTTNIEVTVCASLTSHGSRDWRIHRHLV